jgi:hypothetical protein
VVKRLWLIVVRAVASGEADRARGAQCLERLFCDDLPELKQGLGLVLAAPWDVAQLGDAIQDPGTPHISAIEALVLDCLWAQQSGDAVRAAHLLSLICHGPPTQNTRLGLGMAVAAMKRASAKSHEHRAQPNASDRSTSMILTQGGRA